jgi:hypothetical protein
VPESFSVLQSRCVPTDPTLRDEIRVRTGSDEATSGILRSIERFGGDPSISRYDVSPQSKPSLSKLHRSVAWTVRAVRS